MSYIADTWNFSEKTKVYICSSPYGFYIIDRNTGVIAGCEALYMHYDGTFHKDMIDKYNHFNYHKTYQDAVDCCVKNNCDYEAEPTQ